MLVKQGANFKVIISPMDVHLNNSNVYQPEFFLYASGRAESLLAVGVKAVELPFILNPQKDQQAARYPSDKPEQIDQRESLVLSEVAQGEGEVDSAHNDR
ncbi:MAG: hypothetical protein ACLFT3_04490 [Cyclobacteriaceae bacterium]